MWKDLSIQQKSEVMKMAISQGLTDLNEIKKMYDASIPNIEASSVNNTYSSVPYNPSPKDVRYDDGGELKKWKALDNIKYRAIADPNFSRANTGAGDIEYFSSDTPGITYANGYYYPHPSPGEDIILYNPNYNDEQDIRLDALHIMPKDSVYDTLNTLYREAAKGSDVEYNAKTKYQEDGEKYGFDNIDPYEQYFNNEADGLLRNMFIEGSPEYISGKRYYPDKEQLKKWNAHLMPYINDIQYYLETGKRPQGILPELTVTPEGASYAYGGPLGNIYKGTGGQSQKLKKGDIWSNGTWTSADLAAELKRRGIRGRVTSEYRSAAKQARFGTPASKSWHVKNKAIDMVPTNGWDNLIADLTTPENAAFFNSIGIGVLDERPLSIQKQTKATGPHFHIGPDTRARANYAQWVSKDFVKNNTPQIDYNSPIYDTSWQSIQWQPPVVASSRQEDIAPLLVQDNKPLIVEPLEDTSSTPKDFSAIWDQIFPKVENTQEEFNPLLDPSTQFTALQSRPRYQMKPTPIINMPISNGDNDYMLFKPLAKGGNLFDDGGSTEPNINLPDITVYQPIQKEIPNFIEQAIYETGSKLEDVWNIPGMQFAKDNFDSNGRLKDEERNWYTEHGDIYKNNPLEYSAIRKVLDENETKFAINAFGELVPKSVIMDKARELEHAWRMENDRAYRDKVEHNNETYEQYYDRMQNAPIASNTDLDKELAWQYDQNDLDKQRIEKNKADRFAAQQHKGLTEAFAAPFYAAATIPGLAAMPAAVGPFLAAHDGEAIVGGILGTTGLIGGLTYGVAKHDEYTRYKNSIDKINSYLNTPWVRNAIEQARRDPKKSEAIMKQIRFDWLLDDYAKYENGNLPIIRGNSVGGDGTPQNAFLLDRDVQRNYMLKYGYTEAPGDYGLVKKAVGDRDIPVYQQMPDVITRDKLTPIGNLFNYVTSDESNSAWLANSDNLEHAGDYPTALYVDKDGNFYQKAWDLNDYSGGKQGIHGVGLDLVGNPIVVTTGFQPVDKSEILKLEYNSSFEPTEEWEEALKKAKIKK